MIWFKQQKIYRSHKSASIQFWTKNDLNFCIFHYLVICWKHKQPFRNVTLIMQWMTTILCLDFYPLHWICFFSISTKSWRDYIFIAVCLCMCESSCMSVCVSVSEQNFSRTDAPIWTRFSVKLFKTFVMFKEQTLFNKSLIYLKISQWKKKKQEAFRERKHLHVCELWHVSLILWQWQERLYNMVIFGITMTIGFR